MSNTESIVKVELPPALAERLRVFLAGKPTWDQDRVFRVAIASFLLSHHHSDAATVRFYLDGLFGEGDQ